MFAKRSAQPFAIVMLTLAAHTALADARVEPYEKTLLRHGLRAPSYLDLSTQLTNEYHGKKSGLLNLQFGPQLWRANDNIVSLAVVARGLTHVHTQHKDMNLNLFGAAVEYIYAGSVVRPHASLAYLSGQQRSDNVDNPDNQDVVDIGKVELQGLFGYFIRSADLEIVLGYNHAFNTKTTKLETANAKKERVLIPVGSPEQTSQQGSVMLGLRLTVF